MSILMCGSGSCIAAAKITDVPEADVLHAYELDYISSACDARRREFTAGRYAAKAAAKALCPELPEMPDFPVIYGKCGEPLIKGGPGVSISHDINIAAAICWKRGSPPAGIDIHHISGDAYEVRSGFLTENDEIMLCREQCYSAELLYSYAWCAKESLSKLIREGLPAMEKISLISLCFTVSGCGIIMKYGNGRYIARILKKGDILISVCVPELP